eukprot:158305-Prymnesium_polylepis.1
MAGGGGTSAATSRTSASCGPWPGHDCSVREHPEAPMPVQSDAGRTGRHASKQASVTEEAAGGPAGLRGAPRRSGSD